MVFFENAQSLKQVGERRLYLEPGQWHSRVTLSGRRKKYLIDVLRLAPGTIIEVFDGQGWCCEARLESEDSAWVLSLGDKKKHTDTIPSAWLVCSILKGRAFDDVIRMVTEIGIAGIRPMISERVVSQVKGSRVQKRQARWTSIAAEAARQSGRARIAQVESIGDFLDVLKSPPPGKGILLHPGGESSLKDRLEEIGDQARFVLVGPEGGFSPEEVYQARRFGLSVCSLGNYVLRARTAMVVAAAFCCLGAQGPDCPS